MTGISLFYGNFLRLFLHLTTEVADLRLSFIQTSITSVCSSLAKLTASNQQTSVWTED